MTTRVFRARSLVDARQAAVAALGKEAVILTTREVKRGGFLGFLGATEVEVAAAAVPARQPAATESTARFASDAYAAEPASTVAKDQASRAAVVNALRADLRSEIRAVRLALGSPARRQEADALDLAAEVSAMREAIELLAVPRGNKAAALLRARRIEGRAAAELLRTVRGGSRDPLEDRLRAHIAGMFVAAPWLLPARGPRAVIAAVGLSGVGKTTTLAKLATMAKVAGLNVAFVTCDTFRVGGVEQVKRYAALLDVPFETARNVDELEAFLGRTKADIVMLDTSGRPPSANAAELLLRPETFERSQICGSFARHVLLCAPGASRDVDVLRAVRAYAVTAPTALAFTKLDETTHPSGMLHAAVATRLPVALTCAGPRVPEDLAPADIPYIVDQIIPRTDAGKARAA